MFADFDAAAATALVGNLTTVLGDYIPFLLVGAVVSLSIVFAKKGLGKISRWIKGRA